jgi:hypothetical protein
MDPLKKVRLADMELKFHCKDKFSQIENTLLKVKAIVNDGIVPPDLFDEFSDACLKGYVDDLGDQQLSTLFILLRGIEGALKERDLPTTSVTRARDTILFVLQNNGS